MHVNTVGMNYGLAGKSRLLSLDGKKGWGGGVDGSQVVRVVCVCVCGCGCGCGCGGCGLCVVGK